MKFRITILIATLISIVSAVGLRMGKFDGCYFGDLFIHLPCSAINFFIVILIIALIIDVTFDIIIPKIKSTKSQQFLSKEDVIHEINSKMECFKDILITIKTFQSKNRGQKSNVKKARKMLDEIIKIFYQSKTEFSYYKEIEEIVTNINLLYQDYCVTFGMISRKEFILQTEFDMKINLWGKGPKDSASIEGKILILKDKLIELLNREYKPKDELEEDNSKVIAKFDIDKYSYPPINSKEVGITIRNLGNFDLTDLHIRLIELKRLQVISRFEDRSILIRINNNNIDFNLGNDLVVPDKRTIIFGKFSNNRFMILVKESLNPDNLFKKQNPNIKMPNAVWFIKFEISGNIQGKKFRTETFSAQINVVNKVAEIGDIIHVEQDAEKQ